MRKFTNLAAKGASVKDYGRQLGLDKAAVEFHLDYLPYYKLYVELADKLKVIQDARKITSNPAERLDLMREMNEVRAEYRPLLERTRKLG